MDTSFASYALEKCYRFVALSFIRRCVVCCRMRPDLEAIGDDERWEFVVNVFRAALASVPLARSPNFSRHLSAFVWFWFSRSSFVCSLLIFFRCSADSVCRYMISENALRDHLPVAEHFISTSFVQISISIFFNYFLFLLFIFSFSRIIFIETFFRYKYWNKKKNTVEIVTQRKLPLKSSTSLFRFLCECCFLESM